jgi:ribosomal protein S4
MSNFPRALSKRRRSTSPDVINDEAKTPGPQKKKLKLTTGEQQRKRRRRLAQLLQRQRQKQIVAVAGKNLLISAPLLFSF